jgi:hypothetical protein
MLLQLHYSIEGLRDSPLLSLLVRNDVPLVMVISTLETS